MEYLMPMKIITNDDEIFTMTEKEMQKCKLLESIRINTIVEEPVPLPISSFNIEIIKDFIEIDNVELQENYDLMDIYFPPAHKEKLSHLSEMELITLSSVANYLHYPYLLELCCSMIAVKLKGKSLDEIKEYLKPEDMDYENPGWLPSEDESRV